MGHNYIQQLYSGLWKRSILVIINLVLAIIFYFYIKPISYILFVLLLLLIYLWFVQVTHYKDIKRLYILSLRDPIKALSTIDSKMDYCYRMIEKESKRKRRYDEGDYAPKYSNYGKLLDKLKILKQLIEQDQKKS